MMRQICCASVALMLLVFATTFDCGFMFCEAQAATSGRRLIFSTYLGGTTAWALGAQPLTFGQSVACDAQGNTYVTGATQVSDLPVKNAFQATPAKHSTKSAFVAKYDPAGRPLWCTYLGGDNQSAGVGIAAMPGGGVAVSGLTNSDASGPFPVKNAFQAINNGQSDYFVAVFDANGGLTYASCLGGSGVEGTPQPTTFADDSNNGNSVAADAEGLVYVTGLTASGDALPIPFPVTADAFQSKLAGSADAFLCVIDPRKSGGDSLVYSSFLGGKKDDKGHGVAVDARGQYVTIAGFTNSSDFPVTDNALRAQAPPKGFTSNGFVTWIEARRSGTDAAPYVLRYSTYLGADSDDARDDAYGLTLDGLGRIVVSGRTQSKDFPMTQTGPTIYDSAPYLKAGVSNDQPYVVKIDPGKSGAASLVYATFLGGGSQSGQWGGFSTCVAADASGAIVAGGETCAPGQEYASAVKVAPQTFPYTRNAFLASLQGSWDAFLTQIAPGGSSLAFSSYFGGKLNDRAYGLAVDRSGNLLVTGLTFSDNFPVRNPAQKWPKNAGSQNAFVAKFAPNASNASGSGARLLLLGN